MWLDIFSIPRCQFLLEGYILQDLHRGGVRGHLDRGVHLSRLGRAGVRGHLDRGVHISEAQLIASRLLHQPRFS